MQTLWEIQERKENCKYKPINHLVERTKRNTATARSGTCWDQLRQYTVRHEHNMALYIVCCRACQRAINLLITSTVWPMMCCWKSLIYRFLSIVGLGAPAHPVLHIHQYIALYLAVYNSLQLQGNIGVHALYCRWFICQWNAARMHEIFPLELGASLLQLCKRPVQVMPHILPFWSTQSDDLYGVAYSQYTEYYSEPGVTQVKNPLDWGRYMYIPAWSVTVLRRCCCYCLFLWQIIDMYSSYCIAL